jgi:hypothetical protein
VTQRSPGRATGTGRIVSFSDQNGLALHQVLRALRGDASQPRIGLGCIQVGARLAKLGIELGRLDLREQPPWRTWAPMSKYQRLVRA